MLLAVRLQSTTPGPPAQTTRTDQDPVLSTPNGSRLAKALESLDLMVSIDIYRNATSAHAHYILPPTGPLERDHYGLFLLPMAARTIAVYSPPTLPQAEGSLHDWEILRGLASAISVMPAASAVRTARPVGAEIATIAGIEAIRAFCTIS